MRSGGAFKWPVAPLAFLAALGVLLLSHYPLLNLPYYWDELGQFIPASLDIYNRLAWVPYTTDPNVHPPGLMAYLALVWHLAGYSVSITRAAMLAIAAVGLIGQWRLARILGGTAAPAWLAFLFLFFCPLFFAQSEMAQLDMPAMVLTTFALTLFLEKRFIVCAVVCCFAVMVKETAIAAPALFGFLLLRRKEIPRALLFLLPLAPLIAWLIMLHGATGHWFGNPSFTDYNLFYPLNPVRLSLALMRRGYYLLIGSGHIIGTAALVYWLRRRRDGLPDEWRIALAFVGVHLILICILGGAVLERYILPVLPVLYAAFGTAIWQLRGRLRSFAALALTMSLLAACVINPLYPFPMENNLAWTTFVTLNQEADRFVEVAMPGATVASSFPIAGSLRRPEMGYVKRPVRVLEIDDFREANLTGKVRGHAGALIYYSVLWDPMGLLKNPWWIGILTKYYGYTPQVQPEDIPRLTGLRSRFQLCAAGQCVQVFGSPRP